MRIIGSRKHTSFCIGILFSLTLKAAIITNVITTGSEAMSMPIANHLSANCFPCIKLESKIVEPEQQYFSYIVHFSTYDISLQCPLVYGC